MNVALCDKRVSDDAIQDPEMGRWSWIIWVGPTCSRCLCKREAEGDVRQEKKAM